MNKGRSPRAEGSQRPLSSRWNLQGAGVQVFLTLLKSKFLLNSKEDILHWVFKGTGFALNYARYGKQVELSTELSRTNLLRF
jgi:hypothetical protein